MSTARRPGGSWISVNYEKVALATALALVLASSLFLLVRATTGGGDAEAALRNLDVRAGRVAEPADLSLYTGLAARVMTPFQIPSEGRGTFVGELRVAAIPDGEPIPFASTVNPFRPDNPQPAIDYDPDSDGDGLSDKVELAQGLNPMDGTDASADADGDGYSNIEEIQSDSNLRDASSFPPPVAKLRILATRVNPFKLRFLGISKLPDGDRYQLNLRSLERTYFTRIGDEVEGYRVDSYEPAAPEGPTVVLKQGNSTIRLSQGRVINQEARTALLGFLIDGSRYTVQIGDSITLKDLGYKIVDIREDRVVLRDERGGKEAVVGIISSDERTRLTEATSVSPLSSPGP